MRNLANLDFCDDGPHRQRAVTLIELRLLATRAGPTLDFADAAALLAPFERVIDRARSLRIN